MPWRNSKIRHRAELFPTDHRRCRGYPDRRQQSQCCQSGFSAERTTSASIGLNQVIYSEPRFANVDIQEFARKASEASHRALELDVIQQATTGFPECVCGPRTVLDIDRRALSLARTNLDLAQNRVELGSSSAADVFRWESEVANARGQGAGIQGGTGPGHGSVEPICSIAPSTKDSLLSLQLSQIVR